MKYEKQTGTEVPDCGLVATLLNKTSGPLQQHLRLNARNLTTYEDIRATILELLGCSKPLGKREIARSMCSVAAWASFNMMAAFHMSMSQSIEKELLGGKLYYGCLRFLKVAWL